MNRHVVAIGVPLVFPDVMAVANDRHDTVQGAVRPTDLALWIRERVPR